MIVTLNGERRELAEGATVAAALSLLAVRDASRGVAVAVGGEVVPRGEWGRRVLEAGARVEVVRAVQGG